MSSADTLSALGSDLAFSVSYTIASELRSAAVDHEFSDLEVVGALILLSVLLGRSPKIVRITAKYIYDHAQTRATDSSTQATNTESVNGVNDARAVTHRNIFSFFEVVADISHRIAVNLLVQLVAASSISRESDRTARIISLVTVAVFFVFLQNTAETSAPLVERVTMHAHRH